MIECKFNCKIKFLYKNINALQREHDIIADNCKLIEDFYLILGEGKNRWLKCKSCGQLFVDPNSTKFAYWRLRLPTKEEMDRYFIMKLGGDYNEV